jgi:outer membrane biosynthesis protein TonB
MSTGHQAEELAAQAAEAVRGVVAAAEERAAEIIREAEAEAAKIRERADADAAQIRERAEADARAQIDSVRKALDDLGGSLATAVSATPVPTRAEEPEPQPEPEPEPQPETEPEPEPEPEQEVAPGSNGDEAAERLVAMKLAVDGKDPSAIEAELTEKFGPGDRTLLLKDVIARVPR